MYYLHVKSIREKINNGETRGYANVLTALGILKVEMGQFREGELYLLQATNIIGKIYGKESVSYAGFIVNLGILYKRNNQYNLPEKLFLNALKSDY
ncbi:MAG: tetratricopeptide repeat protein [Saprospiraceae bacterium]|nr:tetratricopeptide repeat protein [Saprospiraceae bacterium]